MRGNHVKKTPRYRGSLLALNKQGISYCFMGGKRAVADARLAERFLSWLQGGYRYYINIILSLIGGIGHATEHASLFIRHGNALRPSAPDNKLCQSPQRYFSGQLSSAFSHEQGLQ